MENRIKFLRKSKKLTLNELAEKTGYSFAKVNRDERGLSHLTPIKISAYAKALECSENDILGLDNRNDPDLKSLAENDNQIKKVTFGPDTVPILGHANGSGGDTLVLNYDEPIGETLRHPNQAGLKNSFAFITTGMSMYPRYKEGEIGFAVSRRQPLKEQDCLVEMKDGGTTHLKEFVRRTPKEIICRQLNPAKEIRFQAKDVTAIHAVVGRG